MKIEILSQFLPSLLGFILAFSSCLGPPVIYAQCLDITSDVEISRKIYGQSAEDQRIDILAQNRVGHIYWTSSDLQCRVTAQQFLESVLLGGDSQLVINAIDSGEVAFRSLRLATGQSTVVHFVLSWGLASQDMRQKNPYIWREPHVLYAYAFLETVGKSKLKRLFKENCGLEFVSLNLVDLVGDDSLEILLKSSQGPRSMEARLWRAQDYSLKKVEIPCVARDIEVFKVASTTYLKCEEDSYQDGESRILIFTHYKLHGQEAHFTLDKVRKVSLREIEEE